MTEMLYGSRFLDADLSDLAELAGGTRYLKGAEQFDNVIEYSPRHLGTITLSPELQEALDAAFGPAYEALDAFAPLDRTVPESESLPLPEPEPAPSQLQQTEGRIDDSARMQADEDQPVFVIPETVAYPAVLPTQAVVEPVLAETIFRDTAATWAPFAPEPRIAAEPPFVPEPVIVLPPAAARGPVSEHTPVSPTPFPGREGFELQRAERPAKPSRRSRRIRPAKVELSRLIVPSPSRIANG